MHPIDAVQLAFSERNLDTLNLILGLVMLGVALDLKVADLKALAARPVAPAVGMVAQFLLLPAVAWAVSRALAPAPSVALGLILVGCCPGGNISNYLTWLSGGRVATSVGMTAVSTLAAVVLTPLNFAFWGGMSPDTAALLRDISLDFGAVVRIVVVLLGLPTAIGMSVAHFWPGLAERLRRPFKVGSIAFFALFVIAAFSANFDHFLSHIATVFVPVTVLNALAFGLGWSAARLIGLDAADQRAVSIEVGIQNSGLGLVLVFSLFGGVGGMAVVCAWWGIWHILAGMALATAWRRIWPIEATASP